ncbi:sialin-like [Branchiostoma floridae]|uniref:Sialin-like n=1 Tax=Branchiostoma floridae TaxID=7739 RepID=A0A9J7MF25_BRAFL|nr:sialin-like [Branchiostoma floridae]
METKLCNTRKRLQAQGWILSSFAVGYISSQVIGGSAARRWGGKWVLGFAVAVWSLIVHLATFFTPTFARTLYGLIFARICLGFAEGLGLPTIFHIFANTVPMEERSRAFGYLVASGSIGQTLASVVCPRLQWPMMFYSFGVLGFVWVATWVLCFREQPIDYDEELFLPPKILTSNLLWAIYSPHFAMNWSNYVVLSWLPTYLQRALGANANDISFTAFPYMVNSVVGVGAGHMSDWLGSRKNWTVLSVRRLMTSIGLLGPAMFILAFSTTNNLIVALLLVSVSMGPCACKSSGHMSNHADVAPNHAGITFAVSNTMARIPGIAHGPVTATLVTATGHWYPVFMVAAGVNMVGAMVYASQSSASQVL